VLDSEKKGGESRNGEEHEREMIKKIREMKIKRENEEEKKHRYGELEQMHGFNNDTESISYIS
jgi:hypothetical protein